MSSRTIRWKKPKGVAKSWLVVVLPSLFLLLAPFLLAFQNTEPDPAAFDTPAAYYIRFKSGYKSIAHNHVLQLGGKVTHTIDRLNTLAISLPPHALAALQRNSWVEFIEQVPEYAVTSLPQGYRTSPFLQVARKPETVPWFVDLVQAREAWDKDLDGQIDLGTSTGAGIKICIIDTGLWTGHADLLGMTVTGISQISGQNWDEDGSGHGTHVGGIIGAQNNGLGMIGVLPGASIYIVKIFDNAGGWVIGQSNLAAAVYACRDAGANVINMSLAGSFSVIDQAAMQDLYDNFNILSFSTSANNGTSAKAYPGYYESVINIGSVDRAGVVSGFSQYPPTRFDQGLLPIRAEWDAVELVAGGQIVASTATGNRDYPVYQAEVDGELFKSSRIFGYTMTHGIFQGLLVNGNFCQASDANPSWAGAVVLCERGITAFSDKLARVAGAGGVAAMIYNNVAGEFTLNCSGCTVTLPALRLTRAEGLYFLESKLSHTVQLTMDYGDACGINCIGAYAYYNGTSQAAPAASAVAAWLWDSCGGPANLTNVQIRELLRNSALDLSGTHPTRNFIYGPGWDVATGWGIPQMKSALIQANQEHGSICPLPIDVAPEKVSVCTLFNTSTALTTKLSERFATSTTLTLIGGPVGMTYNFSNNPITPPITNSILSLSNLDIAATGIFTMTVQAIEDNNPANMDTDTFNLHLADRPPSQPLHESPAPGTTGVSLRPRFVWAAPDLSTAYRFELAADHAFTQMIEISNDLQNTAYQLQGELEPGTVYYWRVTAINACGSGVASTAAFRTIDVVCQNQDGDAGIMNAGVQTIFTNTITLAGTVMDLNIHQLQAAQNNTTNLMFWLEGPTGRAVKLIPGSCSGTNLDLSLDDRASTPLTCILNGSDLRRPLNPLANFIGQEAAGNWFLIAANNGDSGSLDHWNLEICTSSTMTSRDFSDHPASYGIAWHTGSGSLRLGSVWTDDSAFGEDQDGSGDDGVAYQAHWWDRDSENNLQVSVLGGNGWISAWADWNQDGDFDDASELIIDQVISSGESTLTFRTPAIYNPGQPVHLRFRLFPSQPLGQARPDGETTEGEVEDYWWQFLPTAIHLTTLKVLTAQHTPGYWLGFGLLFTGALIVVSRILKRVSSP